MLVAKFGLNPTETNVGVVQAFRGAQKILFKRKRQEGDYIDLDNAKDITCQHSRRALVTCVFCSGWDK